MTSEGLHTVTVERTDGGAVIRTARLRLRPWSVDDAEAALRVYGEQDVARWLSPAMDRVQDAAAMRDLLDDWSNQQLTAPEGRWAVELADSGELFAVVREQNGRGAATAQRVGMEWVGETDKYYHLRLQVFRLRKGDLDVPQQRRPSS